MFKEVLHSTHMQEKFSPELDPPSLKRGGGEGGGMPIFITKHILAKTIISKKLTLVLQLIPKCCQHSKQNGQTKKRRSLVYLLLSEQRTQVRSSSFFSQCLRSNISFVFSRSIDKSQANIFIFIDIQGDVEVENNKITITMKKMIATIKLIFGFDNRGK